MSGNPSALYLDDPDDLDLDEEDFDDESDTDSSDCDFTENCDRNSDETSEYDTSDSESFFTDEEEGSEFGELMVACPPEVLQPSTIIEKCQGYPDLVKHRGYRLCGDNIDKNVHTRYMRIDRRNRSLHYFHFYALENRVNFTSLSDKRPDNSSITDLRTVGKSLLPTPGDDAALKKNISILISRILCKHVDFFRLSFNDLVNHHIKHKFSEEMSAKSSIVSLICVHLNVMRKSVGRMNACKLIYSRFMSIVAQLEHAY